VNKMKKKQAPGLCYRCEHRASYLESGSAPRYECKQDSQSICVCYCYTPVKPCILKYPDYGDTEYDKRNRERSPTDPWMVAPRLQADAIIDDSDWQWVKCLDVVDPDVRDEDLRYYTYWRPTTLDEQNQKIAEDEEDKKYAVELSKK